MKFSCMAWTKRIQQRLTPCHYDNDRYCEAINPESRRKILEIEFMRHNIFLRSLIVRCALRYWNECGQHFLRYYGETLSLSLLLLRKETKSLSSYRQKLDVFPLNATKCSIKCQFGYHKNQKNYSKSTFDLFLYTTFWWQNRFLCDRWCMRSLLRLVSFVAWCPHNKNQMFIITILIIFPHVWRPLWWWVDFLFHFPEWTMFCQAKLRPRYS